MKKWETESFFKSGTTGAWAPTKKVAADKQSTIKHLFISRVKKNNSVRGKIIAIPFKYSARSKASVSYAQRALVYPPLRI